MILAFLLFSLPLERVSDSKVLETFTGQVTSRGDLLGILENRLHHWDLEGRLVRSLQADAPIAAGGFDGTHYWLSLRHVYQRPHQGTSLVFSTSIYDQKGQLLGSDKNAADMFIELNGTYFAPVNLRAKLRDPSERPFLIRQITVGARGEKFGLFPGELCFFRLPDMLRDFHLTHQGTFIASDRPMTDGPDTFLANGGTFLVAYALEPKIWYYDKASIKADQISSRATIKTINLTLPGFVKTSGKPFKTNRPIPIDEYKRQAADASRQWSKIIWFGNLDQAYGLAYTIPSGGNYRIRLARLDKAFKVNEYVDVPIEYTVLGTHRGEFLTLHPKRQQNGIVFLLDRYALRR